MDLAPVGNPGQAFPAAPQTAGPNWLAANRDLIQSVKGINAAELFGEGHELTFGQDWETKQFVVRIVNRRTGEVVLQSPPEYMLRLAQAMNQATSPRDG